MTKTVVIGMIGTGWAGYQHANAYRRLYGAKVELRAVCSLDPQIKEFAEEFGFRYIYDDYRKLLEDPDIDVVDIITPPNTHVEILRNAFAAGKHVICEKPVTGYFGRADDVEPIGLVSKEKMFREVMKDLCDLRRVVADSGKKFCYAENWIYSPSIVRCAELLRAKKMKVLVINALEAHKGSHAHHAANWRFNGGGALIRQGTHPIAAAIYLKRQEAIARDETFAVKSVLCDSASIIRSLKEGDARYIDARPQDVEDWAQVIITFGDGTKANITAGDMFLGGIRNQLEVIGSEGYLQCNMNPNNLLNVYFADEKGIEKIPLVEKNDHNIGFQSASVEEGIIRGYVAEIQNFVECVAVDRIPDSDFSIAFDTLLVVYAAYLSAETGKKIDVAAWYQQ